ncbi:hypothetical protein JTB14_009032 [Gonioctena quinquepunctata]|nr:hypothetical protein JTB14_009032 [Gonioctena quinquepunctata]
MSINSSTLIDMISTNLVQSTDSGVGDTDVSDHMLIYCYMNIEADVPEDHSFSYRALFYIKMNRFRRDREGIPSHLLYSMEDIYDKVTFITNSLLQLFDHHAPVRHIKHENKPYSPWITFNLRRMQKLRSEALDGYKNTKNPEHREYYKNFRNLTTATIRAEKKLT